MNLYVKIILILFGIAYFISPVDLIPDILLPYVGWIDDGVVLWTIYYLIRYGKLPWFFFQKKSPMGNNSSRKTSQPPPGQTRQTNKNYSNEKKTHTSNNTSSKNTFKTKVPKSPYEILGISSNASSREIHEAYKKKIKQYHPDKLSHLGEEFSSLANEKFLEIQNAYEVLKTKTNH